MCRITRDEEAGLGGKFTEISTEVGDSRAHAALVVSAGYSNDELKSILPFETVLSRCTVVDARRF
jgi:hypothetical protein